MEALTQGTGGETHPSVRVFGGVGVDDAGGPVGIGGARQQRLLALLVIRHDQVVTIDWLSEYLWDDEERPDAHATRLRTYLSRLRQSLPDEAQGWIETEPGGYRFVAPPELIEHVRFARLRSEARDARDRGDPLVARQRLDEAVALWRGDPFRELEDLDWARADVEQLHLDRLEVLEERWEAELALGRHTQITGELGSFVGEQPLRERAVRQYALALHRSGRTAEALRVIGAFRRELADQTGLDPSPAVVELEQALLDGDSSLDVESVGRPLRGYRLLEEVGAGAFAIVWRAVQPSIERDVAIKQIRSELATRPEFIRRFEVEAHLIARIEHPHIVPLIDYWRDPDSAYLVMRWLGGGTLERRLDNGPLSIDETLVLADKIGEALSAAHDHGVVHRDVKTSNILFDDAGNAYLTDFGIALDAAETDGPEAALSRGSQVYAAPEQLRGEPVGPEADVFSLGVVLYECLTGWSPFRSAGTVGALVDRQESAPMPEVGEVAVGVPSAVSTAISRAVAMDPADRFATVSAFVEALLEGVAPQRGMSSMPPEGAGPVANPYRGLRAFDDGDADRFFGRDRLVDEMVGRLAGDGVGSRCLLAVGPSGSGKSSIVRAGLVPALRRGAVSGSADWFITTMVPGTDVYESLEAALLRIAVNPPTTLLDQLRDGERGVLRSIRRCIPGNADRLVVVIDQFEEVFIEGTSADADRFLDALSVALGDPSSPLRLIATVRADYYDRPLRHPAFAQVVKAAAIEITPLAPDELVESIVEPARRVGVGFEPGLVARVAAETVGQPSPLPLLQYTLRELFQRRDSDAMLTVDMYDAIGGLAGALTNRAEALYTDATPERRLALRSVFGRLTNPGATVDTRRRVAIADLIDNGASRWVLDSFGEARLFTFDRDATTREPTVEVAHEALLREWPRAAAWLEEDRELLRAVETIAGAASTWDRGGRQPSDLYRAGRLEAAIDVAGVSPDRLRPVDHEFIESSRDQARDERVVERRRVRRLRRLVVGTTVALVVALVAGGFAFTQQWRADREARSAEAAAEAAALQRETAEAQTGVAESATADAELATLISRATALAPDRPEPALLLALEARRRSPGPTTDRALLDVVSASRLGRQVTGMPRVLAEDCPDSVLVTRRISEDGLREFGNFGGQLLVKDLVTGETTTHGPSPEPCIAWFEDPATGTRWAGSIDAIRQATGTVGGPLTIVDRLPGALLHNEAVRGRLLYGQESSVLGADVVVVDANSLQPVGPVAPTLAFDPFDGPMATASSPDDGLFAIGHIVRDTPDTRQNPEGQLVVLDAVSGTEVLRVPRPSHVTAVSFIPDQRLVLAGDKDGRVVAVDIATGSVVDDMELSDPVEVIAVGTRPDGVVVTVSSRSIELFHLQDGPVGSPVPIPPSDEAWIRPDGTVVVVPTGEPDTIQIIGPTGGPLVEQGWDVDRSALVGFGAGLAGVVERSGDAQVIDLDSGDRTDLDLMLPNGERFDALAIVPERDGYLAWNNGSTVARWQDGKVTEQLELWSTPLTVSLTRDDTDAGAQTGGGYLGDGAAVVFSGSAQAAYAFDPTPGELASVSFTLKSPAFGTAAVTRGPDGGLRLALDNGVLRTYDRDGKRNAEIPTSMPVPRFAVTDASTGLVALGGAAGAVIVDPSTGAVQPVAGISAVASLGFARSGSLLVVVEYDGTVRLWDTGQAEQVGILWNGSDTAPSSPPWYDASTDSVWVATSGAILRFSLDPEQWADRVCALVGRELSAEEWDRLVPGDSSQQPACT